MTVSHIEENWVIYIELFLNVNIKKRASNVDGFDVVHPPCNKNVIRTDLAIKASKMIPQDQRFGEDGDFGKEVVRLVKKRKLYR